MLINEINKEKYYLEDGIQKLLNEKKIAKMQMEFLRTDKAILENYSNLLNKGQIIYNKKQKKLLLRNISNLEEEHIHLKKDYEKYNKINEIIKKIKELENQKTNVESYVDNEINLCMDILVKTNFVNSNNNQYCLMLKGEMAANIHEIHSLAVAEILIDYDLNLLTVEELVSVLSIFTDVRLSEENKYNDVDHCRVNTNIKTSITKIKRVLNKYYDMETKYQTSFSQSYEVHYDMCEFMYKWCFADNEVDCRKIYDEAGEYDIYVGEFIKAILKINNICSELEKVCLIQENVQLLKTLSEVKEKTLKSIATNQSLYL